MSEQLLADSERPSGYDALLLLSFGGPEGMADVLPFLENVTRGKNVPRERLMDVATHYEMFGGVSPLNMQNRTLLAAILTALNAKGPRLPVYWGNLHWHPMLADTVRQMADDGVRRALAFVTSAFGSYSGCRQYQEALERACQEIGPTAPRIEKLRLFYNHPDFIEATAERVATAFHLIEPERRAAARLVFSAHSIPVTMASHSPYEHQLREACRLVAERVASLMPTIATASQSWALAFQSRSGPPSQPWLEPDIREHMKKLHGEGVLDVVVMPIGFLAENMEVVYDLDVEVREVCEQLGITMVRASVVGCHPRFVTMIRELVMERIDPNTQRLAIGSDGAWPDACSEDCCQ
jgi:ferrochelatase